MALRPGFLRHLFLNSKGMGGRLALGLVLPFPFGVLALLLP